MSLAVLILQAHSSLSAPVYTSGFQPESGGRGTFAILFSCVLTLFLCVYTAVHLNIPRPEASWKTRIRELWWCVVGLFGPELIVFVAARQWASAHALSEQIGQIPKKAHAENPSQKKGKLYKTPILWSAFHAHYATMGGYAIEPTADARDVFGRYRRLTLTPRGVLLLAKCGYLYEVLQISKDEIVDKSKADRLSKVVTIFQAGWMFVDVVSRLASGLPATLLEVNTLGHVGCALAMYCLWFKKPRQIKEPTVLNGEWVNTLGAFMYTSSRISGRKGGKRQFIGPGHHPPPILCREGSSSDLLSDDITRIPKIGREGRTDTSQSIAVRKIASGNSETRSESIVSITIDANDQGSLRRFELAAQAIAKYPAVRSRFQASGDGTADLAAEGEELLVENAPNWPTDCLFVKVNTLLIGIILWSLSIAYGCVHTAAWNSYFPTTTEKWLWHASGIWVAFSGFVWVFINLAARACPPIDRFWIAFNERKTHWAWDIPIGFLCGICGIAYGFSRAFLVIEAFISLRKLPLAAYDTPTWTQVIPHL